MIVCYGAVAWSGARPIARSFDGGSDASKPLLIDLVRHTAATVLAMTKRIRISLAAFFLAAGLLISGASLASADPAFGPGNEGGGVGNSGPQDGKCHPPGQTEDVPGCK